MAITLASIFRARVEHVFGLRADVRTATPTDEPPADAAVVTDAPAVGGELSDLDLDRVAGGKAQRMFDYAL